MSNLTYREQKDIENQETLRRILAELPPYVKTFFRGIEPTTTSRTRIAYATDLKSISLLPCQQAIVQKILKHRSQK